MRTTHAFRQAGKRTLLYIAFAVCALSYSSAAAASTLAVSSATAAPGSTTSLSLSFTSDSGTAGALQWTLNLPAAVASFTIQAGPAASAAGKTLSCNGNVCILAGMNSNPVGNGVVATIAATAASTMGSFPVQLANTVEAEIDGSAGSISATAGSLTVASPVSVAITPATATLSAGQTAQFSAAVTGSSNTAVTWSLNPAVGSVTAGLYTAPASITSTQTLTVMATSTADTTKSASATVTLIPPVSVAITPVTATLSAGQTAQFSAAVTGSSNTAVTWSLNPAIGSVNAGLYTAPASMTSTQTVMLTATSAADTTKSVVATITLTPSAPSPSISIWPSTATPAIPFYADNPVELGVKFRSDVAGTITGIRFYKGAGNTGVHTGSLWSAAGALLATGTFTNETAAGWQQLTFATSVTIASNTTYIASYHSNAGLAVDVGYFQLRGADNPPLHALQSGVDGANGVFVYGAGGTFPNNASNGHNYWVDVTFTSSSVPPSTGSSIWSNTTTPSIPFYPDNPVELGTKFRSDVAGTITAVRFYKGSGNTGTHTGSLWSSTGALLATGTFTNETVIGWQTLTFATPVMIAANTTYIASYHSNTGLAVDVGYFQTHGADNAPLHALQSGVDGANGVFIYGPGSVFPSNASNGHNYWVDVVFQGSSTSSIWANTTTPSIPFYPDGPLELGVKFRSDVAGRIAGIRFYKGSGNTGTHTGSLWSSDGKLMATGTFINETASGWQVMAFTTPVPIAVNTTYIASYHTNTGLSVDVGYFQAQGADNPPLHALQSGVDGANGVFLYGPGGAFPSNGSNGNNYWVDVIFAK